MPTNWADLRRAKDQLVAGVMGKLTEQEREVLLFLLKEEVRQRDMARPRVKQPLKEKIEETIR